MLRSYSTFPTPFLGPYFEDEGYENWEIGINLGSYQASSLIGYVLAVSLSLRPAVR